MVPKIFLLKILWNFSFFFKKKLIGTTMNNNAYISANMCYTSQNNQRYCRVCRRNIDGRNLIQSYHEKRKSHIQGKFLIKILLKFNKYIKNSEFTKMKSLDNKS